MVTKFEYNANTNLNALTEATKELLYCWRHNMLENPCPWIEDALTMYKYLCKDISQEMCSLKFLLMIPDTNVRTLLNFKPNKYTSLDDGIQFWKRILAPEYLRKSIKEPLGEKQKQTKKTDISVHFKQVCSHRNYIHFFATLFEIVAVMDYKGNNELYNEFYKDWECSGGKTKIIEHDICKIGPYEIFGYFLQTMWNEGSDKTNKLIQVKEREPEWTTMMWQSALLHHYISSPHHPENYEGKSMSNVDLCESTFDMLAYHLQLDLCAEKEVSAADMIQISPEYLERYNEWDRKLVIRLLFLFREALDRVIVAVSTDQLSERINNKNLLWMKETLQSSLEIIKDRRLKVKTFYHP